MLSNAEIAYLENKVKEELDESIKFQSLKLSWEMTWERCLHYVYDILFYKVGKTKSRMIPKLEAFTSLFGKIFDAGTFTIGENTATITTQYDVFVFEINGKGGIRLYSSSNTHYSQIITYLEPVDVLYFIENTGIATAYIEPIWKAFKPRQEEVARVERIKSQYSSKFSDLTNEYSSALYYGEPIADIEKRIRETEIERLAELGGSKEAPSMVETIRMEAEKSAEERRKHEERSRRIREAIQKKKEGRTVLHNRYADDIEARIGVRPDIRHRVPINGGKHYDSFMYPLPNGQTVSFKYIKESFTAIIKDAVVILPPLRTLSEFSSNKIKVTHNHSYPATLAMLRYWKKKAEIDLGGFAAFKGKVDGIECPKVSFHVNRRSVEVRLYFKIGGAEYLSASLTKDASEGTVAAFLGAVTALAKADSSRRKGRALTYSID